MKGLITVLALAMAFLLSGCVGEPQKLSVSFSRPMSEQETQEYAEAIDGYEIDARVLLEGRTVHEIKGMHASECQSLHSFLAVQTYIDSLSRCTPHA